MLKLCEIYIGVVMPGSDSVKTNDAQAKGICVGFNRGLRLPPAQNRLPASSAFWLLFGDPKSDRKT